MKDVYVRHKHYTSRNSIEVTDNTQYVLLELGFNEPTERKSVNSKFGDDKEVESVICFVTGEFHIHITTAFIYKRNATGVFFLYKVKDMVLVEGDVLPDHEHHFMVMEDPHDADTSIFVVDA